MSIAGPLIQTARARAGLSQRELALRAGTSQAAIGLYERGARSPTVTTLERILHAAGFELRARLERPDDHDDVLARWWATLPDDTRRAFETEQRTRVEDQDG